MLPPGEYCAEIKEAVLSKNANTGSSQFVITLDITHAGVDGKWIDSPNPEEAVMYWYFTERSSADTWKKLAALNFGGDFANPQFNVPDGFAVKCEHESFNGKTRDKWDLADWGGGGNSAPVDQKTMLDMNARWKAQQLQGTAPPSPTAPPSGAPTTDDGVPF